MAKLNQSPCWDAENNRDCPDRHIGCHARCGKFKAWRAKQDEKAAKRLHEAEMQHAAIVAARRKARRHTNNWGGQNKTE